MKCLVTGGAGFIGSHLVDRLIADDHEVHVWDNLSTGRRENANVSPDDFWRNTVGVHPCPNEAYDWIFHLAGRADLVPSIEHPDDYLQSNVMGTVAVLEHARRTGCRRFIYTASSSCYGQYPVTPTTEKEPVRPLHPYAISKKMGEDLVMAWGRLYRLPVISLRLFNVFGPRARSTSQYGAVIGTFLAQKCHGQPLTIVGDGTQSRDFVHVEDVARALVMAAESDALGEVFNVGSGRPISINRLALMIGGSVTHIPRRGGEPVTTWADITKMVDGLGWHPQITIEDGIKQLLSDMSPWETAKVWTPESIETASQKWNTAMGTL